MLAYLKKILGIGASRRQAELAKRHADDAGASASKADSAARNAEMALAEIRELTGKGEKR